MNGNDGLNADYIRQIIYENKEKLKIIKEEKKRKEEELKNEYKKRRKSKSIHNYLENPGNELDILNLRFNNYFNPEEERNLEDPKEGKKKFKKRGSLPFPIFEEVFKKAQKTTVAKNQPKLPEFKRREKKKYLVGPRKKQEKLKYKFCTKLADDKRGMFGNFQELINKNDEIYKENLKLAKIQNMQVNNNFNNYSKNEECDDEKNKKIKSLDSNSDDLNNIESMDEDNGQDKLNRLYFNLENYKDKIETLDKFTKLNDDTFIILNLMSCLGNRANKNKEDNKIIDPTTKNSDKFKGKTFYLQKGNQHYNSNGCFNKNNLINNNYNNSKLSRNHYQNSDYLVNKLLWQANNNFKKSNLKFNESSKKESTIKYNPDKITLKDIGHKRKEIYSYNDTSSNNKSNDIKYTTFQNSFNLENKAKNLNSLKLKSNKEIDYNVQPLLTNYNANNNKNIPSVLSLKKLPTLENKRKNLKYFDGCKSQIAKINNKYQNINKLNYLYSYENQPSSIDGFYKSNSSRNDSQMNSNETNYAAKSSMLNSNYDHSTFNNNRSRKKDKFEYSFKRLKNKENEHFRNIMDEINLNIQYSTLAQQKLEINLKKMNRLLSKRSNPNDEINSPIIDYKNNNISNDINKNMSNYIKNNTEENKNVYINTISNTIDNKSLSNEYKSSITDNKNNSNDNKCPNDYNNQINNNNLYIPINNYSRDINNSSSNINDNSSNINNYKSCNTRNNALYKNKSCGNNLNTANDLILKEIKKYIGSGYKNKSKYEFKEVNEKILGNEFARDVFQNAKDTLLIEYKKELLKQLKRKNKEDVNGLVVLANIKNKQLNAKKKKQLLNNKNN